MKLLWYWYVMRGAGSILGKQVREMHKKKQLWPNCCGWHHYFSTMPANTAGHQLNRCFLRRGKAPAGGGLTCRRLVLLRVHSCACVRSVNASLCNTTPLSSRSPSWVSPVAQVSLSTPTFGHTPPFPPDHRDSLHSFWCWYVALRDHRLLKAFNYQVWIQHHV